MEGAGGEIGMKGDEIERKKEKKKGRERRL